MYKVPIPVFSVVKPLQTLMDKNSSEIISDNSDVIILEYKSKTSVLVCAFGNYRKSVITDVSILKAYPNGK